MKTASQIQRTPFLTLALTLLGVLMLSITRAHLHAQDITYQAYVDGVFRSGSHRELGEADLFVPLLYTDRELLFADLRGKIGDDSTYEGNWGIGYRKWLSSDWIVGMYGFYDLRHTANNNNFQQGAFGVELLDVNWDFRVNGYVPERGSKAVAGGGGGAPTPPFFAGNGLFAGVPGATGQERPYYGMDFEVGRLLHTFGGPFDGELRGYFGGFYFDNDTAGFPEIAGPRARSELRLFDLPRLGLDSRVVLGAEWQWDDVRNTQAIATLRIRVPFGPGGRSGRPLTPFQRRMVEPVIRDIDIVTNEIQGQDQQLVQLTDGGNPITVTHVNNGTGGAGTVEDPFNALPATQNTDILYIHSNTTFNGQGYAGNPNQRVLGEGDNNNHLVNTDQLGAVNLPVVNGTGNPRPVINGGNATFAFDAANGSEISNFNVPNATRGVRLNGLAGNVNINRTLISGGGTGIDILGGTGTFTFTDVSVADPAGAGIHVDGGSSTVNFGGMSDPVNSLFGPSTLTQSGGGSGIQVEGGHTGTFNQNPSSPVFADSGDGLQFDNADGIYNFNGPVTLNGGDAGIDILSGSGGTFTFSNTDITNPTGEGINVDGGTADVTFGPGSSLTQANNATGINIQGGHSGQFDFGGSVNATNGDGLQFDNANGIYNFTGPVTLNGGDAGIDILAGSAGTFTFTNTDITSPSGIGLNVDGGTADVTLQLGSSITQGNNAAAVNVQGGHSGTVTFDLGTNLNATNGTGLQFMDADGTYIFNGGITLDGTSNSADTGIDIISDSGGTFTFSGTFADPIEITNDQGVAFNMDSSPGTATLDFFDINQSVGAGIRANNSGTLNVFGTDIDNTTGDGINSTNTNLTVNLAGIGINAAIGDDGIEVVNNDGTDRTATITSNNIFPLAGTGIANRGIFIDSSGTGTLEADVRFNSIVSTNQTILTTSGPTASSLILDLQNSTLTTDTPGVFTEEHVGGGLHSTIVRSWVSPNQVIGSVINGTGGGGTLFDQVTFDADANPGNGYQQVQFTGTLDIGSVPPLTITRVTGDGLSFINPTGDLSIQTLNIANFNGTGLEVDTKGLGTTFNLVTGGGTINTLGGPTMFLDPPVGAPPLVLNLNFDSLNSVDSPQAGVVIDNVAGDLNVTGSTIILNYVGTPVLKQNADGLNLNLGTLITN